MSDYKDFIPGDQDPGALGAGFADFVLPREPEKTDEALVCPECGTIAQNKAGLASHMRKHKE